MAKLRKGVAYRKLERPYTRRSKFKGKAFVRANPNISVVRFNMGDPNKKFSHILQIISSADVQVRHNSIESARQSCNRNLEGKLGKSDYYFTVRIYPHHILRENPLAAGAGADRMSTGMAHSFGKPIGAAAQVRKGQVLFQVDVDEKNVLVAKDALSRCSKKFSCAPRILIRQNK